MIAGPSVPGVGESRYQPGRASGSSNDGTSTVPSALRPSSTRAASSIPMDGTDSATGADAAMVGGPVVAAPFGGSRLGAGPDAVSGAADVVGRSAAGSAGLVGAPPGADLSAGS